MADCPVTATVPATNAVAMMSARMTTNYPAGMQGGQLRDGRLGPAPSGIIRPFNESNDRRAEPGPSAAEVSAVIGTLGAFQVVGKLAKAAWERSTAPATPGSIEPRGSSCGPTGRNQQGQLLAGVRLASERKINGDELWRRSHVQLD